MGSIRIRGVFHCYGPDSFELTIDKLDVKDGQVTALIGESGCGKTTLLRAIAGLEIPKNGSISIDDIEVCNDDYSIPPEKRNVGLVFQDYALFPHLSVQKNIEFGLSKLSVSERQSRIDEIVTLTKIENFLKRYPHELSGGQQQRVALARALVCKPKVLLLDEPFSNMDEPLKVKLRSEIKALVTTTNTTTLLVSHDFRDAFAVADSIVILKKGKIEQIGTAEELRANPQNEYVQQLVGSTNV